MPTETSILFAYIGPETIVPATSFLAAIGGLLLTFGRSLTVTLRRGIFWLVGRNRATKVQASNSVEQAPPDHELNQA